MKYCEISVCNSSYAICKRSDYGDFNGKRISWIKDTNALFVAPSLTADFFAELPFLETAREKDYIPALIALAEFFFSVRGLPLDEIEIDTPCGIYSVRRVNDLNEIETKICKHKFTKNSLETKGVVLDYHAACDSMIFEARNFEEFDFSLLPTLLLEKSCCFSSLAVFSVMSHEAQIEVRSFMGEDARLYFSSAALVSKLLLSLGRVNYNSAVEFFLSCGEKITVLPSFSGKSKLVARAQFLGFREI